MTYESQTTPIRQNKKAVKVLDQKWMDIHSDPRPSVWGRYPRDFIAMIPKLLEENGMMIVRKP